jgi:polygalacturonase
MSLRKKVLSLILASAVCAQALSSAASSGAHTSVEMGPVANARQIAEISEDTIVVTVGSTYSFTVDSPEDQGPVSTTPDVAQLLAQIVAKDASTQSYRITDKAGFDKKSGPVENGDRLTVTSADGQATKTYTLQTKSLALSGQLTLEHDTITVNTPRDLRLSFTAGQRSPDATVKIVLPAGINASLDNTTVNVIGRGEVTLRNLPKQSIGRVGSAYSYSKVGEVSIAPSPDGGSAITFSHLDLRPANGPDLVLVIRGVKLAKTGAYPFTATYTTSQPQILTSAGTGTETATLTTVETISDFARVLERSLQYKESPTTYTSANFTWTAPADDSAHAVQFMHSSDEGKTWAPIDAALGAKNFTAAISGLTPNKLHHFQLIVRNGETTSASNTVQFYSGKLDIKTFGVPGDGKQDDTDKINAAIAHLAEIGGGTLLFSEGTYNVRTVHLQSNVYLYLDKGATINALKGADAPESTWFSDKKYRSGLSPTDPGPYENPENWLTKQDVGHHYFRNTMFFGERLDNVKIIGNGLISGNGNLVTGDNVMRNPPDNRADKMFTLKLCTNVEIGGINRSEDLWYDPEKDEPYYIGKDGAKIFDVSNMLQIDRAGHFALLATGTDGINVHNTYFAKHHTNNARDLYDFMQCNDVTVTNIYSKVSSDDIVKPGSDCSLGFTRPVKNYRVRNIIGDTNCNLFQIGSETADDITDLCVDNIYVLGANKAGFSISTNDGAHIKDVHLNCGHTGPLHSRSKMLRTHTPFFISISNRGRVLGATVSRFKFVENGKPHDELLNTNINIGVVENVLINGIDVTEMYAGSSFRSNRWPAYDGKMRKAAPIIAGYKLPDPGVVEGGLTFQLPNGKHTGYVKNVVFNDVHFVAKGGNPASDTERLPPELGVGQYNASNLGVLPAYGLWARHVEGLTLTNCTFNYEKRDSTYALYLENVTGGKIFDVKMVRAADAPASVRIKNSGDVTIGKAIVFDDKWGQAPHELPPINHAAGDLLIGK